MNKSKGLLIEIPRVKKLSVRKQTEKCVYKYLIVHFKDYEDMSELSKTIKCPINIKSTSIWFSVNKGTLTHENALPKKTYAISKLLDMNQEGAINKSIKSWEKEWKDMPEFNHEDLMPFKSVAINFKLEEDLKAFERLVKQKITNKTQSIWYPKAEIEKYMDKRYLSES